MVKKQQVILEEIKEVVRKIEKTDLVNKDGKPINLTPFPHDYDRIKTIINEENLSKETKQTLFVMVDDLVNFLNASGSYKWFPDVLKPIYPITYTLHLLSPDSKVIKLLEKK